MKITDLERATYLIEFRNILRAAATNQKHLYIGNTSEVEEYICKLEYNDKLVLVKPMLEYVENELKKIGIEI